MTNRGCFVASASDNRMLTYLLKGDEVFLIGIYVETDKQMFLYKYRSKKFNFSIICISQYFAARVSATKTSTLHYTCMIQYKGLALFDPII